MKIISLLIFIILFLKTTISLIRQSVFKHIECCPKPKIQFKIYIPKKIHFKTSNDELIKLIQIYNQNQKGDNQND